MDSRIGGYYRENPAPVGSAVRKCAIDIETLIEDRDREDTDPSPFWGEEAATSWAKN